MRMAKTVLHWDRIDSEISDGRCVTRQSDTPYLRPSFAKRAIDRRVGSKPSDSSLGIYRWASSHATRIGIASSRSAHTAKSKTTRHSKDTTTSTISDGTAEMSRTV